MRIVGLIGSLACSALLALPALAASELDFTLDDPDLGGTYSLSLVEMDDLGTLGQTEWVATVTADFTTNPSTISGDPMIVRFEFKAANSYIVDGSGDPDVTVLSGPGGPFDTTLWGPLQGQGCGDNDQNGDFICISLANPVDATGTSTWQVQFAVADGTDVFAHHIGVDFDTYTQTNGMLVSLANPIPEPSSALLFGVGALLVGGAVRRASFRE